MFSPNHPKYKLAVWGFLLPGLIIWAVYFGVVKYFPNYIFQADRTWFDFGKVYFYQAEEGGAKPFDLIVLGDSTSKTAVFPPDIRYLTAANFGMNSGTALTSYHMMKRYLKTQAPPKCWLFLNQYNWEKNYESFFDRIVFYRVLDWPALKDVWKLGKTNGIWPATEFTASGFYAESLLSILKIEHLPLNLMQDAVFDLKERKTKKFEKRLRGAVRDLGFQNKSMSKILPSDQFFNSQHITFRGPFRASATEDFYLQAMAALANKTGSRFLYGPLPVADVDEGPEVSRHLQKRNRHIEEVLKSQPDAVEIRFPATLPADLFFDFNHFLPEATRELQKTMDPYLKRLCE